MPKPILSIGIIFKDNIRSLERCLSALEPLRQAVHCEVVMADTGSTDGSRAVAEKYADILIDFPWINDFAAARNAVMDRCTGRWFMTVDTDEYLEEDVSELVAFLRANNRKAGNFCTVVIRNYNNYELEGPYMDFMAIRMARMSTGVRYEGSIHEKWVTNGRILALSKTVFRHDGYVGLNGEEGKEKRARNIQLIREEMEQEPRLLMPRLQFIESGATEPDLIDQIRSAMELVEEKPDAWERVGPPIFRHAIYEAWTRKLPEVDEWTRRAWELFPDSLYIRIDVNYASFVRAKEREDWDTCLTSGEAYLQAMEDFRRGVDASARIVSVFKVASPYWEHEVKLQLADIYLRQENPQRALELLESLDGSQFDGKQTVLAVRTLRKIHVQTELDTAPMLTALWQSISQPKPNQQRADQRRQSLLNEAKSVFSPEVRAMEAGSPRLSCTLYAPLEKEDVLGLTAAILAEKDPDVLTERLAAVEDWNKTPVCTLRHAMECGAEFPLPNKPLQLEEMDSLAGRLAREGNCIFNLAIAAAGGDFGGTIQDLFWTRALVLAAVRSCKWQEPEQGMAVARALVQVERVFLPQYYAPSVLREEGVGLLPIMHRFGWYCIQAFDALERGSTAEYVHFLRDGLSSCPSMKAMVEFLLDHTEKVQEDLAPPPELLALANQVHVLLARYDPSDPAVDALKASAAYQKVAYLLERR